MKIITYQKFCDFVHQKITSDSQAEEIIKKYLLTDFEGNSEEFIKPLIEGAALLGNSNNLFIPNQYIYISMKKLTILTLACVCDMFVTKGAVTALGVALGRIGPCIYKLEKENCCIFAKILFYNTVSTGVDMDTLLQDYTEKCTNSKNIHCVFCKDFQTCRIQEKDIYLAINKLIVSGVVEEKKGLICLA